MHGSAIAGLADLLNASGLVHEQEELDPTSPIKETLVAVEQKAPMPRSDPMP
jgi:hypothetical protein